MGREHTHEHTQSSFTLTGRVCGLTPALSAWPGNNGCRGFHGVTMFAPSSAVVVNRFARRRHVRSRWWNIPWQHSPQEDVAAICQRCLARRHSDEREDHRREDFDDGPEEERDAGAPLDDLFDELFLQWGVATSHKWLRSTMVGKTRGRRSGARGGRREMRAGYGLDRTGPLRWLG